MKHNLYLKKKIIVNNHINILNQDVAVLSTHAGFKTPPSVGVLVIGWGQKPHPITSPSLPHSLTLSLFISNGNSCASVAEYCEIRVKKLELFPELLNT